MRFVPRQFSNKHHASMSSRSAGYGAKGGGGGGDEKNPKDGSLGPTSSLAPLKPSAKGM